MVVSSTLPTLPRPTLPGTSMPGTSMRGPTLPRDIEAQNDFAGKSRVLPLVTPTGGPAQRHPELLPTGGLGPELAALLACCEWVNGHQTPGPATSRPRRPTPSAGALYPTELVVCTAAADGRPAAWHHDPAQHGFRRVRGHPTCPTSPADPAGFADPGRPVNPAGRPDPPDPTHAASRIDPGRPVDPADPGRPVDPGHLVDLRPGQAAFVMVSVLWRTVQRYGLRGYRYCLLDASIMAAHLTGLLWAAGARRVTLAPLGPSDLGIDGRSLRLGPAEAGLLRVVVEDGWPTVCPPPWSAPTPEPASVPRSTPASAPSTTRPTRLMRSTSPKRVPPPGYTGYAGYAEPPHLSPTLTRIHRMRALAAEPASRVPAWPPPMALADFEDYLRGRRSADAFGPGPDAVWAELDHVAHRAVSHAPWVMESGLCFRVLHRSQLGGRWADVVRACQGQAIVADASALVVFGLLGAPANHARFATAVLDAGFAVARLYEASWRAGWATTTIGGFTDRSLAALTGWPGFQPIVAQAFGHVAVPSGRCRSDVVRTASWCPHGGGPGRRLASNAAR
jgi:hypothetical protein